ncbi:TetR/AcrR family transcriptional regulator [Streptomyces sp. NPDC093085]|uniref:TetR/AcrR family transcriptional regulator n=1 Tax=Streptomyces sp. NPDC093085 TaxID=3155068 RepID=UPI0034315A94
MSTSHGPAPEALAPLVQAALKVARDRDTPVGDVPLLAVAEEAGISRSTLMRRLGGTRQALDDAVRAAGVDPSGQEPVRRRAVVATGTLISEQGLAAVTLERVAERARCSVHSLYAAFGGRDELLRATYEAYSPVVDLEALLAGPRGDLPDTVRAIYRLLVDSVRREPRVMPAVFAEALAGPTDSAGSTVADLRRHFFPRMLASVGEWLTDEIAAGRIRDIPVIPLVQQLTGPVIVHFLLRSVTDFLPEDELPTPDETIEIYTQAFLRAVARP